MNLKRLQAFFTPLWQAATFDDLNALTNSDGLPLCERCYGPTAQETHSQATVELFKKGKKMLINCSSVLKKTFMPGEFGKRNERWKRTLETEGLWEHRTSIKPETFGTQLQG